MMKSELIAALTTRQETLTAQDVETATRTLVEYLSTGLSNGERIEVRGFGSFSLRYRLPRIGRNPKTGAAVTVAGRHVPHFKPGKELRERVMSMSQNSAA